MGPAPWPDSLARLRVGELGLAAGTEHRGVHRGDEGETFGIAARTNRIPRRTGPGREPRGVGRPEDHVRARANAASLTSSHDTTSSGVLASAARRGIALGPLLLRDFRLDTLVDEMIPELAGEEHAILERPLTFRLDPLHIPDGDQPGAQVLAEVRLAADADAASQQRLGVEAGGDVEVGDGRAVAADQGEDLVAVDPACRGLDEADRVVGAGRLARAGPDASSSGPPRRHGGGFWPGSTRSCGRPGPPARSV